MKSYLEKVYFTSPPSIQSFLVTLMGYRLYAKRYAGDYRRLRDKVHESREWSYSERESYQNEKLFQMVKYCRENISYYKKLFSEYGLHQNDITQLSDLRKIPLLKKDTLRKQAHLFYSKNEKPFVIQSTSGSTGTPLSVYINEETYKLAMALLVDHEERHGVPFGARRATFAGRIIQPLGNMSPPFSRFNKAENQRLYSSYHLNDKTFPHYKTDLDRFQPVELIGYPSAISDLASHYERTGDSPNFRSKAIITNSETLLGWQRERIERVFKCPVFDYYGTAEYITFAGEVERDVYKTNSIIGVTEILPTKEDPNSGDIIATTLTNTCMPLLRYQIGDTATRPETTSAKDVHSDHLVSINGRIDDYIKTPDGRRIGRIDHVFKGLQGINEAQIKQTDLYNCTVVISISSETEFSRHKLIRNFKERLGEDMALEIQLVDYIPRGNNGKFKSVISQL